jgi:hypothetical protein
MNRTVPLLELHGIGKLRGEEFEEARTIQAVMLPAESLRTKLVTISHEFRPVSVVGGDFLDYFELLDGTIGLYLCDVSGKGLSAALYAALAVGTLRGVHKTGASPSDTLATFNRRLMIRGMPRRHAAIQYAVFDPRSGELHIASAGMPGPFHLCADGCRSLGLAGIPPGVIRRHQLRNIDHTSKSRRFRPLLHRWHYRRVRPGWRAVRARAPPGPLQESAPFIANGNTGPNFFRGSIFFARPRAARRYGSSSAPLLRLVDTPAMCSHRHVESGQRLWECD